MINLYLKTPETLKSDFMVDEVCSYLKGNRGFIENDIVVTNPDKNDVFCISLGDNYSDILEISAEIVGLTMKPTVQYYLGEECFSGIRANSKQDLLRRLSDRIDELLENNDINLIEVSLNTAI